MAAAEKKSFKELFEESLKGKHFQEGEIVDGTVIQVLDDFVLVDIGYKSEGQIPVREFRNEKGEIQVQEGDHFPVYIEKIENSAGTVQLSRQRAEALQAWDQIVTASKEGQLVEGIVIDKVRGGFTVDIGVRAFVPASLIDVRPPKNLNDYVGQKYRFKVIKLNKKRGNVVVSRKAVLEDERAEKREKLLHTLEEGSIVDGVIKNITEYGAFIDLGGVDGLLHITDMSWGRLKHPSEILSVGSTLQVKVLKYDPDKGRVSLGLKQLQADPWDQVKYKYRVDDRIQGKVISLTDYGAFVEIEKGVEGLIHVSEMSWTQKVKHPSQVLKVGDQVDTQILEIDPINRRISLGLKQTQENPWDILSQKFPPGTKLQGEVKNLTDFGVFVDVGEGVDGLVHVSDISWTQKNIKPQEAYNKGDKIDVVVLNIDPENEKFSLGIKQLEKDPWEDMKAQHKKGSIIEGKITKVVDFGYFIQVTHDIEGLVHISEITGEKHQDPKSLYKVGDAVRAEILSIDNRERKISLSIKSLNKREEKESLEKYLKDGKAQPKSKLGDLFSKEGGLLQKLKSAVTKKEEDDDTPSDSDKDDK
ncbi:MAG: 30S ribosomal protein S1 [Deltaproteobacteria bacterium RIFCSPHIGHO2_02_FULL_40_11]|nr:MAG: 30S ribosomal protein S1 [Deltaproteobacteria bacterium RIFCSPHIGHO2_02_FULL_40_11]